MFTQNRLCEWKATELQSTDFCVCSLGIAEYTAYCGMPIVGLTGKYQCPSSVISTTKNEYIIQLLQARSVVAALYFIVKTLRATIVERESLMLITIEKLCVPLPISVTFQCFSAP